MNRIAFAAFNMLLVLMLAAHAENGLVDQADRFFVDAARGNDSNTGFRAAPLRTIQEGIDRANQIAGGDVVVAIGTYAETLTLASNVDIRGGFDSIAWTRDAEGHPAQSTIEGGFTAVTGTDVTGLLFEGFVVKAMDAGDQVQTSSIALSLHNSADVIIRQNTFMPGDGGFGNHGRNGFEGDRGYDGGNGSPAVISTDLTPPRQGGVGGSGASPFDGGKGGNGGRISLIATFLEAEDGRKGRGNPGTDELSGFGAGGKATQDFLAPLEDAEDGTVGVNGFPGVNGVPGRAVGTFAEGAYRTADGGAAEPAAGHGGGGGGGGGAIGFLPIAPIPILWAGPSGGGGGSGGAAGGGGVSGQGGGASIGILLTESMSILITENEFLMGSGGNGGEGGFGAAGGGGGTGGVGGSFVDTGSNIGGNAGDGGNGGRGGSGADGGNGGGGPSIGIAEDRPTTSIKSGNVFTLGYAGSGGSAAGSAVIAPDGLVAETFKDFGALDINKDLVVNAVDVQLVINGALGLFAGGFNTDVDGDNETNAVDVQLVINAALGINS
jgi:hypothetical protein